MSNIIKHIVKIEFKPNQTMSAREKTINENIQKHMDILNEKGFITISHKVINKNDKFASVELTTQQMIRV